MFGNKKKDERIKQLEQQVEKLKNKNKSDVMALTEKLQNVERPTEKVKRLEEEIENLEEKIENIEDEWKEKYSELEKVYDELDEEHTSLQNDMDTLKQKSCELVDTMKYQEQVEYSLRSQLKACEFALSTMNVDSKVLLKSFNENNAKIKQLEPGYKKELEEQEKRLEEERRERAYREHNVYREF